MMRISATVLEAFRLYLCSEWMSEAALLDTLYGRVTPSPAMALGSAFHAVLETPDVYRVPHGYHCGAYRFSDATMDPLLSQIDRRGVFEVKATTEFEGQTLVAQADQLRGATIHEFKTTATAFDAEKYTASYQWRVMALIFDPAVITYHVASLDDHGNSVVELRDLNHVSFYPYAALKDDCRALMGHLVDYVQRKGLSDAVLLPKADAA